MKKFLLFIVAALLTFAFVACKDDNPSQSSDDLPHSSVPSSDENSEWGDIEFPRP